MNKKYIDLPLRTGVGIVVLNKKNPNKDELNFDTNYFSNVKKTSYFYHIMFIQKFIITNMIV